MFIDGRKCLLPFNLTFKGDVNSNKNAIAQAKTTQYILFAFSVIILKTDA